MVSSNDVQRLYLQAILSRRILSQKLAAQIWYKCAEAVKGTVFVCAPIVPSKADRIL
ncbi:uncharacterized protein PHACADRAFT_256260 [Phanerochaete carnosa HHB-10118-sp]|uniref:Uncharacterized protein n=1 Tax=Phanerochaete carnosa (strain HHB-10118-sp) TaxID=650164 RepID=K5W8M4_PHACS|nr:uncharacterized protein PHACADRAFT_256260 [Phanerochaete carnosa HHB-10118-sp]EKM55550.1 hypothetical protein PHACADRAFT_256260 [Phanerochaete carnosa HHB-10118-sp]